MFKRLGEEKITALLETGISEFAENGFDKANINVIAKQAGLSVGVIYKYYTDKDNFFLACVRYSLRLLQEVLEGVVEKDNTQEEDSQEDSELIRTVKRVMYALIEHSKKHADYYVMYHEITAGGCRRFAPMLAAEIESISAKVYIELLENAKRNGIISPDTDCRLFAFFFDNLLMLLQFSYCCDYYKERMRIYCGDDVFENDERMVQRLVEFLKSAVGVKG